MTRLFFFYHVGFIYMILFAVFPIINAGPLQKLNQNAYGASMQTIKQWKYYSYSDFFILLGLLIVKIYVSFLFWKKKSQGFDI